jgi:hypothetical protein
MTNFLTLPKKMAATNPEATGETNHDTNIIPMVFQLMAEKPLAAKAKPQMQPRMSWVVDTSMPKYVATKSQTLAEKER